MRYSSSIEFSDVQDDLDMKESQIQQLDDLLYEDSNLETVFDDNPIFLYFPIIVKEYKFYNHDDSNSIALLNESQTQKSVDTRKRGFSLHIQDNLFYLYLTGFFVILVGFILVYC